MLLIKTYLKKSRIPGAGVGLFCGERVRAGQAVALSVPGTYQVFTDEEYNGFDPEFKNFVTNYSCYKDGTWILESDNEKFVNHSRNPNLNPDGIARRDIFPGDELTYDYREVDDLVKIDPPEWI